MFCIVQVVANLARIMIKQCPTAQNSKAWRVVSQQLMWLCAFNPLILWCLTQLSHTVWSSPVAQNWITLTGQVPEQTSWACHYREKTKQAAIEHAYRCSWYSLSQLCYPCSRLLANAACAVLPTNNNMQDLDYCASSSCDALNHAADDSTWVKVLQCSIVCVPVVPGTTSNHFHFK